MSKALYFALFVAGAAIGSLVTWTAVKNKYEQYAQEEIDEVRAFYAKKNATKKDPSEPKSDEEPETKHYDRSSYEQDINDCEDIILKNKYSKKEEKPADRPYVISPDEFGENEEYERVTLTYFADRVLADDMDDIVEDPDNVVGLESLETFGEYEDDTVFVRNEARQTDYEICLDDRRYEDVVAYPGED